MTLLLTAVLVACSFGMPRLRAEEPPQEYQLKLAFIINFGRFINWPENALPDNTLNLCVLGDNPFGGALQDVEGKRVGTHRLKTKVIGKWVAAGDCQLLFVPESWEGEYFRQQVDAPVSPMVAIGETPGFVERGGGIEFIVVEGRLGFAINNSGLQQRGVRVGSSLLSLAAAVR